MDLKQEVQLHRYTSIVRGWVHTRERVHIHTVWWARNRLGWLWGGEWWDTAGSSTFSRFCLSCEWLRAGRGWVGAKFVSVCVCECVCVVVRVWVHWTGPSQNGLPWRVMERSFENSVRAFNSSQVGGGLAWFGGVRWVELKQEVVGFEWVGLGTSLVWSLLNTAFQNRLRACWISGQSFGLDQWSWWETFPIFYGICM